MSVAVNYYLGIARGKTQNPGNVAIATAPTGTLADAELRIQIDNGTTTTGITKEDVILSMRAIEQYLLNTGLPTVNPILYLSPVAYYRYGSGITQAVSGFASQWADTSGNGNHLLQATAGLQPAVSSDGSLLFDGTDDYMQTNAFTLNQPCTAYLAFRQVTWTSSDRLFDGLTGTFRIGQTGTTPNLNANAGNGLGSDSTIGVGTNGVLCFVGNGASSVYQAAAGGATSTLSGDAGTGNPGGITLGAIRTPGNYSNISVMEMAVFASAHDAPTRLKVLQYLARLSGILPPAA